MRVLFVNGRADSATQPGGDTMQMLKTKAGLEAMGITIEVRDVQNLDNLPAVDIAHLFNIQMPESPWQALSVLQKAGIPTVLSSIYWDMLAHWFEIAVEERPHWRWIAGLVGKERTRQIYINRQRKNEPKNKEWQIQRRLLQTAVRVLPNSQSEADLLQETFALGADFQQKVDVVPNGIDPTLYDPIPQPSDAFYQKYGVKDFILQVGTIASVKNQLGLIEALFDLPVPLVFIGQPKASETDYVAQCKARGAERGNTIFIDRVPHDQLSGIYALAAVHALPSWRETPGLVSLEAGASGCRIVTTSIGSTRDYFGDLAWYCYPNDWESIRTAVQNALNTSAMPDLRHRILTEFIWQRAAEASLKSYQKVISGN